MFQNTDDRRIFETLINSPMSGAIQTTIGIFINDKKRDKESNLEIVRS